MIYLFATQFQSDVNVQLLETPYNADLQIYGTGLKLCSKRLIYKI